MPLEIQARVAAACRGHYRITDDDGAEYEAEAAGSLRHRSAAAAEMPVTGDWVTARLASPDADTALIVEVLPRRTVFTRGAAGRRLSDEQPVAANIDLVLLVCGLDGDFNPRRLERYLVLTAESGARAAVLLNKCDLRGPEEIARLIAETEQVARHATVLAVSAIEGSGMDRLAALAQPGETVALLGSSGVGKSAIANFLLGGAAHQRTAPVRASDSRGRHTTTARELFPLPDGAFLIDTPGMRELRLWAGEESVSEAFGEIATLAAQCRFRDCTHGPDALGCAVRDALDTGELRAERLASFAKLQAEARRHEESALERKQREKRIHRGIRRMYREREERLR